MRATYDAIVNKQAGTVQRIGTPAVGNGLQTAFGDQLNQIIYTDALDLQETVRHWLSINAGTDHKLLIGGGDGTVLTATTEILNSSPEKPLGILPLGTTNQTSYNLGFSKDFITAARQLREPREQPLPVGRINESYFLLAASLDENTVQAFDSRELLRRREFATYLEKMFVTATNVLAGKEQSIVVSTPDNSSYICSGSFILAVNPQPANLENNNSADLKRKFLHKITTSIAEHDGDATSLHICKDLIFNAKSVLEKMFNGRWTDHPSVTSLSASEIVVTPVNSPSTEQPTKISVDGEVKNTTYPIRISRHKCPVSFLAPA